MTLFERARQGDTSAQEELNRVIRRIARAISRQGGPGGAELDWEDIAQEAAHRFFTVGINQYCGRGSEAGYLLSIVRSTVLQAARRADRRRARESSAVAEVRSAAPIPQSEVDVRRILSRLPDECARLLEQVFLDGVPYSTLASRMEMQESSVRVKVSRCLRKAMEIVEGGLR